MNLNVICDNFKFLPNMKSKRNAIGKKQAPMTVSNIDFKKIYLTGSALKLKSSAE